MGPGGPGPGGPGPGRGQRPGPGGQGQGYDPRGGGYGPQRGGGPQYDQRQRAPQGRGGYQGQGQGGWGPDEDDPSFMPGFGGRGGHDRGGNGRDTLGGGRGPGFFDDPGDFDRRGPGRGGRGPERGRDRGYDDRGRGYDDYDDDRARKPRKKATRWLPRLMVTAVILAVLGGGGYGAKVVYGMYQAKFHPPDFSGQGTGSVLFQVMSGDTPDGIAGRLQAAGIIASTRAFHNAASAATTTTAATGTAPGLTPGFYLLHLQEKASLVYAYLINPKNAVQNGVTVPEGMRTADVLTLLATKTKLPLSQFQAAAKDTAALGLPSYAGTKVKLSAKVPYGQVEGFLFPDTYPITPHETPLQILQAMVKQYNVEAAQMNLDTAAQAAGLTPSQVIIMASMVQAEAGSNAEMPKVASVFDNRDAAHSPQGSDAVDGYGVGLKLLNIPNNFNPATAGPYDNTQVPGFPPTPIDNPGLAAIDAVLHPAKTSFQCFLAEGPGKPSLFSTTCPIRP